MNTTNEKFEINTQGGCPTIALEGTNKVEEETPIDRFENVKPLKIEDTMSDEDLALASDLAKQIDIQSTETLNNYGMACQQSIANLPNEALKSVKTKALGESGEALAKLTANISSVNWGNKDGKITSFINNVFNKAKTATTQFRSVEKNIDSVVVALEKNAETLTRDALVLENMIEENKTLYRTLSIYIAAGKVKLEETRSTKLKELTEKAKQTGDQDDAQAASDLSSACNRFEKRLHDLMLSRTVAAQTGPQIKLIQNDNFIMVDKINSTINNTIPLWKTRMVIALSISHTNKAIDLQAGVTKATNNLIEDNARQLKIASVRTAEAAEQGIVSEDSLIFANDELISALKSVMDIQKEGSKRRAETELTLAKVEAQIKQEVAALAVA